MKEDVYEVYSGAWYREMLLQDEQVLWSGSPQGSHWFTKEDILLIPFSLFWCGFALLWEISVLSAGIWPFALFGLLFVGIGLYLLAGRLLVRHFRWKKMRYAITNGRILWQCGAKRGSRKISQLPAVELTVCKDGSGTISFGSHPYPRYYRRNMASFEAREMNALEFIPEPERVHRILMEQQR